MAAAEMTPDRRITELLAMLERMETQHVILHSPDGEEIHPDWCRECRVTKAERERDEARAAIADIDRHATPVGLLNNDDPEGSPHHYLVTTGSLHRALSKAYTAEPCESERKRLRAELDQLREANDHAEEDAEARWKLAQLREITHNKRALMAGMLVGILGEHDTTPLRDEQLERAADLILRNWRRQEADPQWHPRADCSDWACPQHGSHDCGKGAVAECPDLAQCNRHGLDWIEGPADDG